MVPAVTMKTIKNFQDIQLLVANSQKRLRIVAVNATDEATQNALEAGGTQANSRGHTHG